MKVFRPSGMQVKSDDFACNSNGSSLPSPGVLSRASFGDSPVSDSTAASVGDTAQFEPVAGCSVEALRARNGDGSEGEPGLRDGTHSPSPTPTSAPDTASGALWCVGQGSENEPAGPLSQGPSGLEPLRSSSGKGSKGSSHIPLDFGEKLGQDCTPLKPTQFVTPRRRRPQ